MSFDREQFKDEYPFASHWLELDGGRMHYLDEGQGSPVVMVHGNPTWSFYFRDLVEQLSRTHRVIVPDHIGCGLSDKPGDDHYSYRLERRVADLDRLLDHLGLDEDLSFVLHDWGGMIGMTAALRRAEAVRRLVILNTAAFLLPQGKRLPLSLWLLRHLRPFAALSVRGANAFAGMATRMATAKGLSRRLRQAYTAPYDSWANRIATLRFVQDIPLSPADPSYELCRQTESQLERFAQTPMLVCWGARDFVFDDRFLDEWIRRFPDADVHRFADAGHYVLEDARDEILPLVAEFLGQP